VRGSAPHSPAAWWRRRGCPGGDPSRRAADGSPGANHADLRSDRTATGPIVRSRTRPGSRRSGRRSELGRFTSLLKICRDSGADEGSRTPDPASGPPGFHRDRRSVGHDPSALWRYPPGWRHPPSGATRRRARPAVGLARTADGGTARSVCRRPRSALGLSVRGYIHTSIPQPTTGSLGARSGMASHQARLAPSP
jgi:hypothetical protein